MVVVEGGGGVAAMCVGKEDGRGGDLGEVEEEDERWIWVLE